MYKMDCEEEEEGKTEAATPTCPRWPPPYQRIVSYHEGEATWMYDEK